MKQLLFENNPINDAIATRAEASGLAYILSQKVVYYPQENKSKVTLISGGGAGHEPAQSGFVGPGMLDASVSGNIFASPSTNQVIAGVNAVKSDKGSVIIVMNYTGDVIHFGTAVEKLRAVNNYNCELVSVGDDISVNKKAGRRGLAGTILVHKIAGALAAEGKSLKEVAEGARAIANNVATIAASLEHCTVPGRKNETFLQQDEMEIGMGIHNEPGVKIVKIPKTEKLVKDLVESFVKQDFVKYNTGDETILLVNSLGGISMFELSAIAGLAKKEFESTFGVKIVRLLIGSYMTAFNGPGFSFSLLNATKASSKLSFLDVLKCYDYPVSVVGWPSIQNSQIPQNGGLKEEIQNELKSELTGIKIIPHVFKSKLETAIKYLEKAEPIITKYDTIIGDGDCGETLMNGGNAILQAIKSSKINIDDAAGIMDIAQILENAMDGTSGSLYTIFLSGFAKGIKESGSTKELNADVIIPSLNYALETLCKYTQAREGDRTLMDALIPFVKTFTESRDFEKAVKAARNGADNTINFKADFGRASYVNEDMLKNIPDPGAIGLATLFEGLLEG